MWQIEFSSCMKSSFFINKPLDKMNFLKAVRLICGRLFIYHIKSYMNFCSKQNFTIENIKICVIMKTYEDCCGY